MTPRDVLTKLQEEAGFHWHMAEDDWSKTFYSGAATYIEHAIILLECGGDFLLDWEYEEI